MAHPENSAPPTPFSLHATHTPQPPRHPYASVPSRHPYAIDLHATPTPLASTPLHPRERAPKIVVETGVAETSSMPKRRPEKGIMIFSRNSCGLSRDECKSGVIRNIRRGDM